MKTLRYMLIACWALLMAGVFAEQQALAQDSAALEAANPIMPIPDPPLGIGGEKFPPAKLTDLQDPPTPESVRLGEVVVF